MSETLRQALAAEFGNGWKNLSPEHKGYVLRDFADMVNEEFDGEATLAAYEYSARIGRSNILSYAQTMAVRYRREGV